MNLWYYIDNFKLDTDMIEDQPKKTSAGVVIIRYENNKPKFLLMRSYEHWDFPKGGIESGENKLDAAKREVMEESGITELDFCWGKTFYETKPYGKNQKVVFYFIARTEQKEIVMGINPVSGKTEHEEYRWVELDEAKKLTVPRINRVIDWAMDRINNLYGKKIKYVK